MSASDSLLAPLAHFIADFSYAEMSSRLESRMYATVNDWTCAAIAGLGHPLYEAYVTGLAPSRGVGSGLIAGQADPAPLMEAAAANAAISHLWEIDDAHKLSATHPGIVVMPTMIALAQSFPETSGDRLRGAIVAGYEAMLRIGSFLGKSHYAVCHTTATAGSFGAAATAAHLLGFDFDTTLSALGHAGTQAQGMWQFLDDQAEDAKAFHAATAVRNGLSAAFLARAGIKGAPHILEGRRGLLAGWKLTDTDPSRLEAGETLMIEQVTVKNWPTCGQMHTALDCAEALADKIADPASIEAVIVEVPRACLDIAGNLAPRTVMEAKFSTAFCVAATLARQKPDLIGLTEQLLASRDVWALCEKVSVRENTEFTAQFPLNRPARISVRLSGGASIEEHRTFRKGDPELFWDMDELRQRAERIVTLSGHPIDVDGIDQMCRRFSRPDGGALDIDFLAKVLQTAQ